MEFFSSHDAAVAYEKRSHYMVERETRVVITRYIGTDHKTVKVIAYTRKWKYKCLFLGQWWNTSGLGDSRGNSRSGLQWTRSTGVKRGNGCAETVRMEMCFLKLGGEILICMRRVRVSWWRCPCDTGRRCGWSVIRCGSCDTFLGVSWAWIILIHSTGLSTPTAVFKVASWEGVRSTHGACTQGYAFLWQGSICLQHRMESCSSSRSSAETGQLSQQDLWSWMTQNHEACCFYGTPRGSYSHGK